jgi:hypothetical protein
MVSMQSFSSAMPQHSTVLSASTCDRSNRDLTTTLNFKAAKPVKTCLLRRGCGLHGLFCLTDSGRLSILRPCVSKASSLVSEGHCCGRNRAWKIMRSRVSPLKKSQPNSKPTVKKDATADGKIVQGVVRIVRDGTLVHCYLACGHMLTFHAQEVSAAPSSMECWACEAERNGS